MVIPAAAVITILYHHANNIDVLHTDEMTLDEMLAILINVSDEIRNQIKQNLSDIPAKDIASDENMGN